MPHDEETNINIAAKDVQNAIRNLCCCCVVNELFLCCMPISLTFAHMAVCILQGIGTFKNEWIIADNNTNVSAVGFNEEVVKSMHLADFICIIVLLVVIYASCIRLWCLGDGRDTDSVKRVCFIYFVPTADFLLGVMGLVACVWVSHSDYKKGISFYICMTSSSIQIAFLPILSLLYVLMRKNYVGIRDVGTTKYLAVD